MKNRQRGSLLIHMVVGIAVAALLGAGMFYYTATASHEALFAHWQDRAYYVAEAGGRYAETLLLADLETQTKTYPGGKKPAEPTPFTMANGDIFTLISDDVDRNGDGIKEETHVSVESTAVLFKDTWMETKRKITFTIPRSNPTGKDSVSFLEEEKVFVYGNELTFGGDDMNGAGATVVIKGGLDANDLDRGACVAVSTIYIGGSVTLDGGSASLGSPTSPGNIYINGSLKLWDGGRDIYGDVYVNGNFYLKDAAIHGNVYVNGNLQLDWTPELDPNSRIYYTGTLKKPKYYDSGILAKCIKQAGVPGFTMPDFSLPPLQSGTWFAENGYQSSGALADGLRIYTEGNYTSSKWTSAKSDVVIISKGDISITNLGGSGLTGVLYAPYGKVTFNGEFFTGFVLARDGFFVTSGGTTVTFKGIEEFLTSNEYPFVTDKVIQY